jgi:hypothetical protein
MKHGDKLKEKYGEDFFAKMGAKGGSAPHKVKPVWHSDRTTASKAGHIGGSRSKRGYKFIRETNTHLIYERKLTGETVQFDK